MLTPRTQKGFWLTLCVAVAFYYPAFGKEKTHNDFNDLRVYNVVWDSPSRDHSGSMPVGNGDIGLNVWVEASGDLLFYIGKTDAWGDNARLLKVGKIRISLRPNPLKVDSTFHQTLNLQTGEIIIKVQSKVAEGLAETSAVLRIWVDANHSVIHITIDSTEKLTATAQIELWRRDQHELPSIEVSDVNLDRSKPGNKHVPTIVESDTVLENLHNRIGWYHRNIKSVGPEMTMKIQGLSDYPLIDPLLGRTFGAIVTAEKPRRVDDLTLTTKQDTSQRLSVYVLTKHPSSPKQWLKSIDQMIEKIEEEDFRVRRRAHEKWWHDFWDRSWIFVKQNVERYTLRMIAQNTHPMRIGIDQHGSNRFHGEIGRVSVLTKVLGEDEIAELSKRERKPLGQDEVLGSWVKVASGQTIRNIAHEDLAGSLTLEAWVLPESLPQSGARIIDKITPGRDDGILLDTWPGNSLRLITQAATLQKKDCLTPGQWHHVVATVDASKAEQELFLDGVKIAESQVSSEDDATSVTRAYHLQRFIDACAGRGRYPIKFNGSIFTVPHRGAPGDADYRRWGPGYWWQNTRLPYLSMTACGDFELMHPLFRMYVEEVLPVSVHRTRKYCGHAGAFIPECVYFWGAIFSETYGWKPFEQREDKLQQSRWHKWEWVSGPELVFMMLDYYEYTLDEEFLKDKLLPTAEEILTFFDQHYQTDVNDKLVMHPSQAVETWWECTNPMPEVAGLHAVTDRLIGLPKDLTTSQQRQFWESLSNKLPELPVRDVNGIQMLAPAEKFDMKRNIENPELYAVFPFRLVAIGKPKIELATEALNNRWDRGNFGWRQDDIFMAYLGLTDQVKDYLVGRARRKDENSRFPAFWGPNYDWVPDQDHGGVLMKALQAMLLQTDGKRMYLLPAWPVDWDVDFKLHAPFRTIIQGKVRKGQIEKLDISPEHRRTDLKVLQLKNQDRQ